MINDKIKIFKGVEGNTIPTSTVYGIDIFKEKIDLGLTKNGARTYLFNPCESTQLIKDYAFTQSEAVKLS